MFIYIRCAFLLLPSTNKNSTIFKTYGFTIRGSSGLAKQQVIVRK